jgi:hypothetical protein
MRLCSINDTHEKYVDPRFQPYQPVCMQDAAQESLRRWEEDPAASARLGDVRLDSPARHYFPTLFVKTSLNASTKAIRQVISVMYSCFCRDEQEVTFSMTEGT